MEKIESLQNNKIKQVLKLRKNRERKKTGFFIIEGREELHKAFLNQIKIEYVLLSSNLADAVPEYLKNHRQKIYFLSEKIFKKISYKENSDGVLAVAKRRDLKLNNLSLKKNPLIIILESVEKPGNLGAILRSVDGAGADALIICDQHTDIYNPNVIRASLGTVFSIPLVSASNEETFKWLQENKIFSFAASLDASQFYTERNFKKSSAIIIGTEHDGLSKFWLQNADTKIKIPMFGTADSLNASVSASIILYEAIRQREKNVV